MENLSTPEVLGQDISVEGVSKCRGQDREIDTNIDTSYGSRASNDRLIATFEGEREGPAPKMLIGRPRSGVSQPVGFNGEDSLQRLRILLFHREIVVSSCIGPTRLARASR